MIATVDEWDALAGIKKLGVKEPHVEWLRAVLEVAEPAEGWTRQFRAAREEKDDARRQAALEKLATADDVRTLPVRALTRLAGQLERVKAYSSAAQLLRRAQQEHPADFWVNYNLSLVLQKLAPPQSDDSVRFQTAAVALRPESPGAHFNLSGGLSKKGLLDASIASYKKAIELDPKFALAHHNLGHVLQDKGQFEAAVASFRKAIELDPNVAHVRSDVAKAQRLVATKEKLLAFLKGDFADDQRRAARPDRVMHNEEALPSVRRPVRRCRRRRCEAGR